MNLDERQKTINEIVEGGICTGCGSCMASCPQDSIRLDLNKNSGTYIAEINRDICIGCGICYKVCPNSTDTMQSSADESPVDSNAEYLGNYISCYTSHSTDNSIRYNSSSGGLITQILIFALEEGLIDGALVTRMRYDNPLVPEPFIARTREDVIEASKSKYCPVPANVALGEILRSKDGEKFAAVGLPCHIQGLRKIEHLNPRLKEKIVLHIGIFCNHTPSFYATEAFIKKRLHVHPDELEKLDYRGSGWPGCMNIALKGDKATNHAIPLSNYWEFIGSFFFTPFHCAICSDGVCELADISLGDAWLPELKGDKLGESIIVSRSNISEKLLSDMMTASKIESTKVGPEKVVKSQLTMLYMKKQLSYACRRLIGIRDKNDLNNRNHIDYLLALISYFTWYMVQRLYARKILEITPLRFISFCNLGFLMICMYRAKSLLKEFL